MKRFILLMCLLLVAGSSLGAMVYGSDFYLKNSRFLKSMGDADPLYRFMVEAETNVGTNGAGTDYFVDSNVSSEGSGTSWATAKDTLDEAINLCTATQGDVIYVAAGHAETIAGANGWDADVAGITIIGLGNGANRPTFTFSATASTVAVGAANVTISNLRFAAGISAVVAGVMVEAAGDNCTIDSCDFPEPTTSTFEFVDAIDLAALADGLTVSNCNYSNYGDVGATHFIDMGNGVNLNTTIVGNTIIGEFLVSAIWSNDIDLGNVISYNNITNLTTAQHCIEFTAAATGTLTGNQMFTDAEATTLDPGSMMCIENYVTTAVDTSGILIPVPDTQVGSDTANIAAILVDTGTTLPATLAIDAAAAAPNYSHPNYFTVVADMTSATWNTAAAHEIAAVTGAARVQILIETTATVVTVGTNGTMALGYAGNTSAIFSATALDAAVTGDVWTAVYGSAATTVVGGADASGSALTTCIFDVVASTGVDIGYTIATNAGTTGSLTFHVWWTPLDATGAVTAGAGGAF